VTVKWCKRCGAVECADNADACPKCKRKLPVYDGSIWCDKCRTMDCRCQSTEQPERAEGN
jgi:uncharacterized Zn finger protein (UPF0148 family)